MSKINGNLDAGSRSYWNAAALLIIFSAVIFYVLTIRAGHNWGGDFALYIAHAKNIVTGHQYSDTGYIFNPREPFLSPKTYPPVFPLVLSPVYALFGLDLHAFKVADILVFGIFLLIFYRYACRRLDKPTTRLLLLAMVAFSPWFWDAKDSILPDYVFLAGVFATFTYVEHTYTGRNFTYQSLTGAIVTGILLYLVYGTRSVGLILVPVLILLDLIRTRTVRKTTLMAVALFAAAYMAQYAWIKNDASYIDSLNSVADEAQGIALYGDRETGSVRSHGVFACGRLCDLAKELAAGLPGKVVIYSRAIDSYWDNGYSPAAERVVFTGIGLFVLAGFVSQLRRSTSISEIFALVYVTVLLVVPFVQKRYLLPLIPLYLLYAVSGFEVISSRLSDSCTGWSKLRGIMLVLFVGVVTLSYIGKYTTYKGDDLLQGVESQDSRQLFDFVRNETPVDSIFVFEKPRPLALFTGRRSLKYNWDPDTNRLWNYLTGLGATHIIVAKYVGRIMQNENFLDMIERHRDKLKTVFENRDFVVYLITGK